MSNRAEANKSGTIYQEKNEEFEIKTEKED